jgi:hypothetical protein
MTLTNLFEDDAGALKVSDDQVSGIAGLAKRAKMLEKLRTSLKSTVLTLRVFLFTKYILK